MSDYTKEEIDRLLRREVMSKEIKEYDEAGNLIHAKYTDGREVWHKYDERGNKIHSKDNLILIKDSYVHGKKFEHEIRKEFQFWFEYDSRNRLIYKKDSMGFQYWFNEDGNISHIKNPLGEEEWYEYNEAGNRIYE